MPADIAPDQSDNAAPAEQEPAAPPEVIGVCVYLGSASVPSTVRHAYGRDWFSSTDRELSIEDEHGKSIALYGQDVWRRVELIFAP